MDKIIKYADCDLVIGHDAPSQSKNSSFEIRTRFSNHTNKKVTVVTRDGIVSTIQPEGRPDPELLGMVEVEVSYCFSSINPDEERDIVNHLELYSGKKFEMIKDWLVTKRLALARDPNINTKPTHLPKLVPLNINLLVRVDMGGKGSHYVDISDTLISNLEPSKVPMHPFTFDRSELKDNLKEKLKFIGSGIVFSINDPENKISQRFVNMNSKVHLIPVIKDGREQRGVWVVEFINGEVVVEVFDITVADERFNLFKTEEEARIGGDIKNILAQKQAEAQAELEEYKHNSTITIAKLKEDQARAELEFQRIEKKRKEKLLRLQEQYDIRSHKRKDTSEVIKYAPALIAGGAAIILTLGSFMGGKK